MEHESLKSEINAQNDKLLNMKKDYDELLELQNSVKMAQEKYYSSLQRLNELQLQSKSSLSESEVTVLNQATPPITHDKPKMIKVMILGVVVAIMLAFSIAMLRELIGRKIVIDDDISVSVGLDVIGHIVDGAKQIKG